MHLAKKIIVSFSGILFRQSGNPGIRQSGKLANWQIGITADQRFQPACPTARLPDCPTAGLQRVSLYLFRLYMHLAKKIIVSFSGILFRQSGKQANRQTGNPAFRQSGNLAIRNSGNPAIWQSGKLANRYNCGSKVPAGMPDCPTAGLQRVSLYLFRLYMHFS